VIYREPAPSSNVCVAEPLIPEAAIMNVPDLQIPPVPVKDTESYVAIRLDNSDHGLGAAEAAWVMAWL
jgi:hypothetical protein